MGSIFKKPKAPDTSKQDALLKQQRKQLEEERKQAQLESDRLRDKRVSEQRRLRGRLAGRRSLISGSELGVKDDKLGGGK